MTSPDRNALTSYVGKDIPHESSRTHVTGESVFLDDWPRLAGELQAGIIYSTVAHAKIKKLDLSAARAVKGVVAILTARDIPGHNAFGPAAKDELLIAEDEAVFVGQPLAIVAAESVEAIEAAHKAAIVEYEPLPVILSIEDAINAQSFLGDERKIERGDVEGAMKASAKTIEGIFDIGGQDHFYLESHISLAIPGEQHTMTVHSSTQHTTEVQSMVAEVLGVPFNHVVCICKRMGGGFGGKETQAAQVAMMASLLAAHTRRPVRFAYSKDDDMRFTGKRHPFKIFYKAGVDANGRINAVDIQLFSNGGCSFDLSMAVLERAMMHSDNAYFLPAARIRGRICKTNLPSNTAFRGFGGPQGVAGIENILEEIAMALDRDALDVRTINCYGISDRNTTPYEQKVENNTLPELFDTLARECDYRTRRRQISQFNAQSPTHLKGMALSAVKFGISFTRKCMNQANALVNIYTDGSVMISTGATEMGQGVNTRIRQVVADELGVLFEKTIVAPTSTDKNNNTSPTAASSGTDLNGAAAADACRRLKARLVEVAAAMLGCKTSDVVLQNSRVFSSLEPSRQITFSEVVNQAYELRVNLGERGFYATPGIDFDRTAGRGNPFLYFTNGVACSEVLIDRFTGQMKLTRTDLLMDVGKPLNPGIDRGQVIGAFIQGAGWVSTEELVYNDTLELLSKSPTTYKIPNISDIPEIFNVRFLDNPNNTVALHRMKTVGEPPLLLGFSVWLAVKDAVRSIDPARANTLKLPATGEEILRAIDVE